MQCALVESFKGLFFFTSCQPNWSILAPLFNTDQDGEYLRVSLPKTFNSTGHILEWSHFQILIEPTLTCSFLEKITILFNTGCLWFFTMTCLLRFYLIVVKQASPHQELMTRPSQIIVCTILGFALAFFWFVVALDDQAAFSRACLAPWVERPPIRFSKFVYYIFLIMVNLTDLALLITMVITIRKVPTAPSINLVSL